MRRLLALFVLILPMAACATQPAKPAPTVHDTQLIVIMTDGPHILLFIKSDGTVDVEGYHDCLDDPACVKRAEALNNPEHLVGITPTYPDPKCPLTETSYRE